MDKAEWREAWERVLPILTFEDKYSSLQLLRYNKIT